MPTARLLLIVSVLVASMIAPSLAVAPPAKIAQFDAMPKVVSLPDGTLAAVIILHRGPGLESTPETQDLLIQYSHDGGKTWGERKAVAKLPTEENGWFGFGINFADRDGEIHVFMLCDGKTGVIRARTAPGVVPVEPAPRQILSVWHMKSTSGRTKWTQPKRIFDKRTSDLLGVTQLKSGRILLPVSGWTTRSWRDRGDGFAAFTYLGSWDATLVYSDDDGQTWQQSESILRLPTPNLTSLGAIEPVVVQLNDGRVWMLIRNQLGRFYESFSSDGAQWSTPMPTEIVSSDSPAGLMRLDDQRILMLWNNCERFPYAQGGRQALHAAITNDDGKTWRGYREVARDELAKDPPPPSGDHGVAYPFVAKTSDGSIVFSLWVQTGQGRSLWGFDPSWLLETRQSDTFAEDSLAWSTFGTKGVLVAAADGSDDGKVLRIAKTDAGFSAGAVRNFPMGASGKLTMRLKAEPNAAPMHLVLTDHFSPPFDQEDALNSVFDGMLGGGISVPTDRWATLTLDWDMNRYSCRASIDGQPAGELKFHRAARGVCYLRLRTDPTPTTAAGYLFDRVDVEVTP